MSDRFVYSNGLSHDGLYEKIAILIGLIQEIPGDLDTVCMPYSTASGIMDTIVKFSRFTTMVVNDEMCVNVCVMCVIIIIIIMIRMITIMISLGRFH
jgi:hypothetical protein